jgi:hypothetical protein
MVQFMSFSSHEKAGRGPKLGERAYVRSPNFGYPLDFRMVLSFTIIEA